MGSPRSLGWAFLGLFCVAQICSAVLRSPSDFLSESDRNTAKRSLNAAQKKDGSFFGLKNTYYAVSALSRLNEAAPNAEAVCGFVNNAQLVDAESVFYSIAIAQTLSCQQQVSEKSVRLVQNALQSDKLKDLYFGTLAAVRLRKAGQAPVEDADLSAALEGIVDLSEEDSTFHGSPDDDATAYNAGLAFEALATIAENAQLDQDARDKLNSVWSAAASIWSEANEGDSAVEFFSEAGTQLSDLRVTSTVIRGLIALGRVQRSAGGAITPEHAAAVAEFFIQGKSATGAGPEDVFFLLEGLSALSDNPFAVPLVATLAQTTVTTGSKANVRVRITDLFGRAQTGVSVFLVKVSAVGDEKNVLQSQQALAPVQDAVGEYDFNILASKPDPGFYAVEIRAQTAERNALVGIELASLSLKVLGTATVHDCSAIVADSNEDGERNGRRSGCDSLESFLADEQQHLLVEFKLKQPNGRPLTAHQAFVQARAGNRAFTAVAQVSASKSFTVDVPVAAVTQQTGSQGPFELTLIVGDAVLDTPISLPIGSLTVAGANAANASQAEDPFARKPDIAHQFRVAEKRPSNLFSMGFTAAVLSPFLVLLIGLVSVRANVANFPKSGTAFLFAVGFQVGLAAIFALFVVYWFQLTMVATLQYLAVLALPTFYAGLKTLNYLAAVPKKSD
eukprot:TRINITY_DN5010_c0_g1_i1.p1 TRINITY_DN5010_c0_g1~~TRINITY_DN5010_c0_g1_i1.p1  ORF type:complete len:676 (+),score=202.64 TRINITY_DN5010_c0_g1_i1:89-2116(+)